jgi:thiol-disulfide isomerase/thioredoxin
VKGAEAEPRVGKGRRRFTLVIELVVVAALVFTIRAYQQRDAASGPAEDFRVASLDGQAVALEDFAGQPVMLHFWASWCGVCRAMEGNVVDVAEGETPVVRVATRSGSAADVRAYLDGRGDTEARGVVLDPDGALAQRYGVRAFPTTFFIDARGRIRHVEVGYTTWLGLEARLWLTRQGF